MMEQAKSISVLRPGVSRAEWTVDIWASAVHHSASGGSGYPSFLDVFAEPLPVPPLGPTVPVCDRSDEPYDADMGKYKAQPSFDPRILDSCALVERSLSDVGAHEWFVVWLLWSRPTCGRYGPSYRVYFDPERPERSFIESGVHHGLLAVRTRKAVGLIHRCEREFFDALRKNLRNPLTPATQVLQTAS